MIDLSSTRALVAEAREKAGKATAGPWAAAEVRHGYDQVIRTEDQSPVALIMLGGYGPKTGKANGALIAASRTLVPALADATERLMEALEAALCCSWCEGKEDDCTACHNSRARVEQILKGEGK